MVSAFLAAFQLGPEEKKALRGTEEGALTPEFFPALKRLRELQVSGECFAADVLDEK